MMESAVNPGMCRCCASEGAFKDVKSIYHWMGEEEIYADMLRECFDIILNVSGQGQDGGICEVCITQLRNAINFKKQVLHTEEQFQKLLQNKTLFRPNIVKVEVQGDEESDDNLASGDEGFSGAEFEVPIKTELDDPKPKKRAAKAPATTTRASAKKAKADNGETSTKRTREKPIEDPYTNTEEISFVDKQQFNTELQKYYSGHKEKSKKLEWTTERILSVIKLLEDFNLAKTQGRRPTGQQYHHASKYDVAIIGNEKVLTFKRKSNSDQQMQIVPSSEYYQRLLESHIVTGHGRRDKIAQILKDRYIMIPRFAITIFIKLCKICLTTKGFQKTALAVKPLISDFRKRGQVDLMDLQTFPDKEYKWLMQYQDHLTRFCFLRPLKSKGIKEVAIELLKIFLEVGCPNILQSHNDREYTASVLKEIIRLWPTCKIIIGRSTNPQSREDNTDNSIQDLKNMIRIWMLDNNSTNWSIGCYFAQFQKNSSNNTIIGKTPYKALFGHDSGLGLSSTRLPKNIVSKLETEEDLENYFEEINKSVQDYTQQQTEEREEIWLNEADYDY